MTKTITKVIAALGVVAGLGVAALPLGTYADDIEVQVRINTTTGSISPDCGTPPNYATTATVAAGVLAESNCAITGSSNTGITIGISTSAAAQTPALALTGYTTAFETAPTNGSTIPAINTQLTSANFTIANIAAINSGAGGWGYQFVAGTSTGSLTINDSLLITSGSSTTTTDWNPITASNVNVASSTGPTTMTGAAFNFRAATPTTQAAGYYSNVVTVTIATTP